jgi:hypothetical protein
MTAIGSYVRGWTRYTGASEGGWGSAHVRNDKRANRREPVPGAGCPFDEWQPGLPLSRFHLHDQPYAVIRNANPIVDGQLLFCPWDHRNDLREVDYALIERLVCEGVDALAAMPVEGHPPCMPPSGLALASNPLACYVNPSPAAGQSVPHTHVNAVDAERIPLPTGQPAPWDVSAGSGDAAVARYEGLPYYALTVVAARPADVHATLTALQGVMDELGSAWNVLAFLEPCDGGRRARFIVVPRSAGFAESVGQRVAGF